MTADPAERCSRHYCYRSLIECGETWDQHRKTTLPMQPESWAMLAGLAAQILDPLTDHFGRPTLTYGFAPPSLTRLIAGRIAPGLDQHAACELNSRGALVCPREGAAVDFLVPGRSMAEIVTWMIGAVPFDRLYYYGVDKPVHVSWHPRPSRAITAIYEGPSGRRIPRQVKAAQWAQQVGL